MERKKTSVRQSYKGGEGSEFLSFRECESSWGLYRLPAEHGRVHPATKSLFRSEADRWFGGNMQKYRRCLDSWRWEKLLEIDWLRAMRETDPAKYDYALSMLSKVEKLAGFTDEPEWTIRHTKWIAEKIRAYMALH